jgi:hypothetical protein
MVMTAESDERRIPELNTGTRPPRALPLRDSGASSDQRLQPAQRPAAVHRLGVGVGAGLVRFLARRRGFREPATADPPLLDVPELVGHGVCGRPRLQVGADPRDTRVDHDDDP